MPIQRGNKTKNQKAFAHFPKLSVILVEFFQKIMDITSLTIATPLQAINEAINNSLVGSLGIEITEVAEGIVKSVMPLSLKNARPDGILHGGASLALAETLAGLGSMLLVNLKTHNVFGIQVSGNHVGSLKSGEAIATAKIIHRGKQTHVWNVEICSNEGRLISSVQVTNMITEKNDI